MIVTDKISMRELNEVAGRVFGDMVKAVVDVEKRIMSVGGELHADDEAILIERGSRQQDLWGINIYQGMPRGEWIEFDSLINIRPAAGNRSRYVENPEIRETIVQIVNELIENND